MRKLLSGIVLALLLAGMFTVAFRVQSTKSDYVASAPIYIRADGSIDPSDAPLSTMDNVTYTLTGNITSNADAIIVERSNITVDGNGYLLQGYGSGNGFYWQGTDNVTIRNTNIKNFEWGIRFNSSRGNIVSSNDLAGNGWGIYSYCSFNNSIIGDNITASTFNGIVLDTSNDTSMRENNIAANLNYGIYVFYSNSSSISGNNVTANSNTGILLMFSSNNIVFHNNFINNTNHVMGALPSPNVWDNGYPSGGNYWGDYAVVDVKNGLYQNESGSDGIGDIPNTIDANNTDRFPLMAPFSFFDAGTWNNTIYYVTIVSNSTLSHFHFNPDEGAFTSFWVKGETTNETIGFCRVTIPKNLLWADDGWTVLYGSAPLTYKTFSDENCTYLHFTYTNPYQNVFTTVTIYGTHTIPEFPSFLILALFMIATLLGVIVYRRRMENGN